MATEYAFAGLAFSAGLIAFLNPCGIAMLPAYISYYLEKKETSKVSILKRILRGLILGIVVSIGFLFVFGIAGIIVSFFGSQILFIAPWLSLAVGVVLVILGIMWFMNKEISILPSISRIGNKFQSVRYGNEYVSYFFYGVGYAIASISCTIPVFLFIVTGALSIKGFLPGIGIFLIYGAGMSVFMVAVSVATAVSKGIRQKLIHKHMNTIRKISAFVIVLSGLYIIYYNIFLAKIFELYI